MQTGMRINRAKLAILNYTICHSLNEMEIHQKSIGGKIPHYRFPPRPAAALGEISGERDGKWVSMEMKRKEGKRNGE